jgi:hypothetical protein
MGRIRDGKENKGQGTRRNESKEKDRRRGAERSVFESQEWRIKGRERRDKTAILF